MRAHRVRALLMGGQVCVFYGAVEFSRNTDFAIVADAASITPLERVLRDEETAERDRDREYWLPLRRELEQLRRRR